MGTVYRARDPHIDRVVAIKTISVQAAEGTDEEYRQRFFREAQAAGQEAARDPQEARRARQARPRAEGPGGRESVTGSSGRAPPTSTCPSHRPRSPGPRPAPGPIHLPV